MTEQELMRAFYSQWLRCESTRGRYSCTPWHDGRCEYQLKKTGNCVCGADALEKLAVEINELQEKEAHHG